MSNSAISNKEIPLGTVIDSRYLIQKVLGQGGLGRTYLAFDTHRFNEPCVLKEFAPLGSGQYDLEKSRDLFKREAKILHQITHPQIPKFLACFEGKGRLFLVQEYVKGKTYSKLLQERQQQGQVFTELEMIRWLMNMLPILTYIHQRGIIHRDISPDNIMQPQGEELPVLIDFGVGKLTNLSYSEEGNQGPNYHQSFVGKMSFVGKIGYAPREQISMGRCSASSDLYALGVTALVLLTGKIPTLLLDQYTLEWQWRKYARVSQGLAQIVDKMIEDRPMLRYQSTQEVITDLLQLKEAREITFVDRDPEAEDETMIVNSSFSSKANAQFSSQKPQSSSTSLSQEEEETELVRPANQTSNQKARQSRPPQPIEEKMIADSSTPSQARSQVPRPPEQHRSPRQFSQPPQEYFVSGNQRGQEALGENSSGALANSFSRTSKSRKRNLEPKFIQRCQQELAYLIGPMASLIVEEILVQYAPSSPEELVDALAEQIPDLQKAIKFKRKLLS